MATCKGRVLVDFTYNGKAYRVDDIAEIDEDDIRMLRSTVDTHPDAIRAAEAVQRERRLRLPSDGDTNATIIVSG